MKTDESLRNVSGNYSIGIFLAMYMTALWSLKMDKTKYLKLAIQLDVSNYD